MTVASHLERCELLGGSAAVLELGPAPGNILDRAAMKELAGALRESAASPALKLVIITGAGENFSFGASVQEHLPGEVEVMLPEFHGLLRLMNQLPLPPVAAAVRGLCLGGGFELALHCDHIVVESDARLGCPEIKLGVFPPAACALLPLRVSAGQSASLVLGGARMSGAQAAAAGLADLEAEPGQLMETVLAWAEKSLLPLSAAALRQARRAARWPWRDAVDRVLPALERQYLEDLMDTEDAREGLAAFVAKRPPRWSNR